MPFDVTLRAHTRCRRLGGLRPAALNLAPVNSESPDGPLPLRLAVLVLWGEAVALGVLAAVELVKVVTNQPANPGFAVVLGLMIGGTAFLAAKAGVGLTHRRGWARSAAIMLQLLAAPVAWFMITGEGGPVTRAGGILIAIVAIGCAALLLAPSSSIATRRGSAA